MAIRNYGWPVDLYYNKVIDASLRIDVSTASTKIYDLFTLPGTRLIIQVDASMLTDSYVELQRTMGGNSWVVDSSLAFTSAGFTIYQKEYTTLMPLQDVRLKFDTSIAASGYVKTIRALAN